jgi:hypothetical protein
MVEIPTARQAIPGNEFLIPQPPPEKPVDGGAGQRSENN